VEGKGKREGDAAQKAGEEQDAFCFHTCIEASFTNACKSYPQLIPSLQGTKRRGDLEIASSLTLLATTV
ncbi:MAG: hypothetical protein IKZ87_09380, partial [Actinomycetaceae bacterium]|nr:hypothetical protein [Actinomycetaceae bacterium]